ncbi:Ldh family oxidoreductase [Sediminicurvatus halobius]|uniref:Malate dehydrogenase n=1 Tax=Sediminicurvatus halobius TaxID=2182432 RepID=A0A2U2MXD2_9GAMM|nr:Ldh family oxidoreductase [Spiribacter halobius]PWG61525.1 malate dehydrogenase [Spiribacter halobius]UEX78004.1 Ldh family oxidoreductase [Spiribacter halobius]
MSALVVTPEALQEHCSAILAHHGLPAADAGVVAASLVDANLRGVDSHGVTRMTIYVERLQRGLVAARPDIRVVQDRGASLLLDGDNGMGAVVASRALDIALERLPQHGSVTVGVRNTNHYGSGAYYAERAADAGAAAFLYSNAPSTMAPWGGVDPYLGTNPYTFAVPAGRYRPVILDMATSVVARGKIILAAERGERIPEGWAIDGEGRPTTDAQSALEGSVLPFGGPKGYGIALMVDIMAGVLTGAGFGPRIGDLYRDLEQPQNVGAFIHLTDVGAFLPMETFRARMDEMIEEIKSARRAAGVEEIFLPGEIERRTAERRRERGIPLPAETVAQLETLGSPLSASLTPTARPGPENEHGVTK